MQKIITLATIKKKEKYYFSGQRDYQMHGMDYRLRAIAVANYLESQLVRLTFGVVGPSGRPIPPEELARPAHGTPVRRRTVWTPPHLRGGSASYIWLLALGAEALKKHHIYTRVHE